MPDNEAYLLAATGRTPWNKGKLLGAKPPLRPKHVWAIRTRLIIEGRSRDLAMFNLAIDSKLRGCDVVALKVEDVAPNGYAIDRATIRQRKTGRPVKFELTEQTREAGLLSKSGAMSLTLADIDGDGDLDLYVVNYRPNTLKDIPNSQFRVEYINGQPTITQFNGRFTSAPDLTNRFVLSPSGEVMELGAYAIQRFGDRPIVLERDNHVPLLDELCSELNLVHHAMTRRVEAAA